MLKIKVVVRNELGGQQQSQVSITDVSNGKPQVFVEVPNHCLECVVSYFEGRQFAYLENETEVVASTRYVLQHALYFEQKSSFEKFLEALEADTALNSGSELDVVCNSLSDALPEIMYLDESTYKEDFIKLLKTIRAWPYAADEE